MLDANCHVRHVASVQPPSRSEVRHRLQQAIKIAPIIVAHRRALNPLEIVKCEWVIVGDLEKACWCLWAVLALASRDERTNHAVDGTARLEARGGKAISRHDTFRLR